MHVDIKYKPIHKSEDSSKSPDETRITAIYKQTPEGI
jgi:hypothetical protein